MNMKGREDMERIEGLYIYVVAYKYESNKTMCIPIQYHDGQAFVLSANKNGDWTPVGLPIKDFSIIDIDTLYDQLVNCGPIPPYDKSNFYLDLIQMELNCGQKYNCIYRPLFTENFKNRLFIPFEESVPSLSFYKDFPIINNQEYASLLRQLEIILDDLDEVFKVVAPQKNQGSVFGHAIRNIIILACTEIDSMMHVILDRNKVKPTGKHFQMKDYYQLKAALRLDEYELKLCRFDDLGTFTPFANWNGKNNPSWYDGYNKIKHNREKEFANASINHAINSIMAFAIVLIAQYGYRNDLWNEKIGKIIHVNQEPHWNLKDFYLQSSGNNALIEYPFIQTKKQLKPEKRIVKEMLQLVDDVDNNKHDILRKLHELEELLL